jgi:anti-anti-sigma regulatory factor
MPLFLEQQNGHTLARLQGELTIFFVEEMQDDLLGLLNHEAVILDLSELTELDGSGAQLLAILQIEAQRTGKSISFSGNNPQITTTLQYLGIATGVDKDH